MTAIVRTDDSVPDPRLDTNAQAADRRGPPPNLEKTDAAIEGRRARSIDLNVLAVLAVLYTLYFAREFLLPIVYAILLNFLLSPVVRWLARLRIKPPIGSALVILAILGALGSGAFKLSSAVRE
ncbi:MAG: AI-2E family transporter, partial [Gemmatimonadaceae bacterium]